MKVSYSKSANNEPSLYKCTLLFSCCSQFITFERWDYVHNNNNEISSAKFVGNFFRYFFVAKIPRIHVKYTHKPYTLFVAEERKGMGIERYLIYVHDHVHVHEYEQGNSNVIFRFGLK